MNQFPRLFLVDQTNQPDSILWLESDGNYTRIHRQQQPALLSARTLKRFEERLSCFIRIRRDVLINPRHIQYVRWNGQPKLIIGLTDGTELTASRRNYKKVTSQLRTHS